MGAVRASLQAPTFYHEVSIDPYDLEAEGWVYVGRNRDGNDPLPRIDSLVAAIRQMHEDEHEGPMRWCQHAVCKSVERDGVTADV